MELRPYQQEAREAVEADWASGVNKTLLVLPTGCGKTIVFAKIAEDMVRAGKKVLILAHRVELLEQAADKIKSATGLSCSVEKAQKSSLGTWDRITVGSVQTMMREKRLAQFSQDHFSTIIIDEAHHAISESYQTVLEHFDGADVLGVTATPDRGDMRSLGSYFEKISYQYSLPQAIRAGYLTPIRALTIPLKIDLNSVKISAGDFNAGEIGTALDPYLEQIATEMEQYCKDKKTVVFLPLVRTSQRFRDIINDHGFRAAEVNGASSDRAEILKDFEENKYNVLCNSMLLTEGWDCPDVDCIVILRPTKVRALYSQMVGRGTRLAPGKDHLLLLDFLWLSERHELCRPACLICEDEKTAKCMTDALIDAAGEEIDIQEAAEAAEKDAVAEREEALAKKLAEMRTRKRKLVDPLQYEMSIGASDLIDYQPAFEWEKAEPTKKQKELLEKRGIFPDEIGSFGEAEKIIKKLKERTGKATPKQIRFLEGRGFLHVGEWDFKDANSMISRISLNHWRVPADVIPSQYSPAKEETDDEWFGNF